METEGLIIGLDIQRNNSQACYYKQETKVVQTVMFNENSSVWEHPDAFDYIYDAIAQGKPLDLDRLTGHISYLIDAVRKNAGSMKIGKICITVSEFQIVILDAIRAAMNKLLLKEEQWCIISHEESYAYYVYTQVQERYRGGVMLLDYMQDGLHAYYMTNTLSNGTEYILEQKYHFKEQELQSVVAGEIPFQQAEDIIINHLNEIIGQKVISSIYLTGPGFEGKEFSDHFTQVICRRRKAFAGQNLFVKGACMCAEEEMHPQRFENVLLACNNRITTGIEADIIERGKHKRLRIIRPGTNWYMARRSMDFILEDMNQISLIMRPCDKRKEYLETIDISDFPYREGKMTRVTMEVVFHADDRCLVTVIDRGFGDFAESSGKVVHKELEMR